MSSISERPVWQHWRDRHDGKLNAVSIEGKNSVAKNSHPWDAAFFPFLYCLVVALPSLTPSTCPSACPSSLLSTTISTSSSTSLAFPFVCGTFESSGKPFISAIMMKLTCALDLDFDWMIGAPKLPCGRSCCAPLTSLSTSIAFSPASLQVSAWFTG